MATETIKGMDNLLRKLDRVAALKGAKRGLKAGAKHIKDKIKKYPPSTQANSPRGFNSFYSLGNRRPNNRWYERGYGPRWARKDGSIGGRKTSEDLINKWGIAERAGGLQQVIGNNASYSIYVHSADDQARFHGRRGWKTDEQVLDEEGDEVLKFIQHEIDKELSR